MLPLLRNRALSLCRGTFALLAVLVFVVLVSGLRAEETENAQAQPIPGRFDFAQSREPAVTLDGLWRFHLGDDPDGSKGWASPSFDDSGWTLIRSDRGWNAQGYHDPEGMAWYRATIQIPAGTGPLSLSITGINDSSEVFADGRLIGTYGGLPPHAYANDAQLLRVYALPAMGSAQPHTLTLAIRVWRWPRWAAYVDGGFAGPIRIGDSALIADDHATDAKSDAWESVNDILLIALEGLAAIASLAFFLLRRGEREYLLFALALLFAAGSRGLSLYGAFHPIGMKANDTLDTMLDVGGHLAEIAFYFVLLRGRRTWLFWSAIGCLAVQLCLLAPVSMEVGSYTTWNLIHVLLDFPIRLWILALLFQRTRQGLADARLLFFPVLLQQAVGILDQIFTIGKTAGLPNLPPHWFDVVSQWPFAFSVEDAADALFLLAMIAIFIYRSNRASRRQEQLSGEMEAARAVQQVLIPEEIPQIPGFQIQTIYRPHGEVGGDFFQILPTPSGGALIAIGDVSGKGMPAALTVSLLVGTLRTLVHYTQSPGEILAAMNTRMLARSSGGFTTCLIVRADRDGTLTIANAGHIAPYLNGAELPVKNSLPLGLAAQMSYPEACFQLPAQSQLTLVTDGIVEARSKSGELFGFDRTAAIAAQTAEAIVSAAEQFGQDDDITVLTFTRQAASAEAGPPLSVRGLAAT